MLSLAARGAVTRGLCDKLMTELRGLVVACPEAAQGLDVSLLKVRALEPEQGVEFLLESTYLDYLRLCSVRSEPLGTRRAQPPAHGLSIAAGSAGVRQDPVLTCSQQSATRRSYALTCQRRCVAERGCCI